MTSDCPVFHYFFHFGTNFCDFYDFFIKTYCKIRK